MWWLHHLQQEAFCGWKIPLPTCQASRNLEKILLNFFLVIWQLKMNHLLTIYRRKRSLLKREILIQGLRFLTVFLWLVKFAKLMGDDMNFEIFIFVFVNPFFSVFFYKLKTWHETEIECHDSLSNQSSSIFKEVEIGIFFILVSFLSTTKKSSR